MESHKELVSCDICKKYMRPYNLKKHKDEVHSVVYAYSCTLCDKKFKASSVLKKHTEDIHKEKTFNFKCNICSKTHHSRSK